MESHLHPLLDGIVKKWSEKEKEEREEFRQQLKFYIRLYGYLSQILKFEDISLEEYYIFSKYLIKKLPKPKSEKIEVDDLVDLDSLRIQKIHEGTIKLQENEGGILQPITGTAGIVQEPEKDLLSNIIKSINDIYGVDITDDDKVNLNIIAENISKDEELKRVMQGDNSEDNQKQFYKEKFNKEILEFVNSRLNFYKKFSENEKIKEYVLKQMFNHYRNLEGLEKIEDLIKKEEGIKHEYKSSFNIPYPKMPELIEEEERIFIN